MSHHEAAPSQHEMDLRYTDALTMADAVMTYRLLVKEVAMRHGVYATFMPKPLADENGSGMHLQLSLFRGEDNAFYDESDDLKISGVARQYIGGLLRYAPELMLLTNQWVNSYKRLVPGTEAPLYATWSPKSHSDLVRVPEYKPGLEVSTRVEYRVPDAACNPYLAFAGVLAAGLRGIEDRLPLPEPVTTATDQLSAAEIEARDLEALPGSLGEAIERFEGSSFLRASLGDHVFDSFVANKKIEWSGVPLAGDAVRAGTLPPPPLGVFDPLLTLRGVFDPLLTLRGVFDPLLTLRGVFDPVLTLRGVLGPVLALRGVFDPVLTLRVGWIRTSLAVRGGLRPFLTLPASGLSRGSGATVAPRGFGRERVRARWRERRGGSQCGGSSWPRWWGFRIFRSAPQPVVRGSPTLMRRGRWCGRRA